MKSGALRRGVGLVFLYAGIFIILVLAQFSKGPGFSQRVDGLAATATFPKAERGRAAAPERVRVSYAGLTIELSQKAPAEAVAADGSSRRLYPTGIAKIEGGVRVDLSSGFALRAVVEKGERDRFSVGVDAPDGTSAASFRLPLSSRSAIPYASNGKLLLPAGGGAYEVTLSSASVERDAGRLVLAADGKALGSLSVSRAVKPAVRPAQPAEKLVARAPKDRAAFAASMAPWRDKAWAALSAARLDAEALEWKLADGTESFSEKALAAYLAESLSRGVYGSAYEIAKSARKKWPDKLSYLTAPYLGNLIAEMQGLDAADAAELKRIAQLVSDASPALCEKEGLVRFLLDRAPASLSDSGLALLASLDPAKISLRQAVGLLGCVADSLALLDSAKNPLANRGSVAARIVAAVRPAREGFFLCAEEDGSCDLRLSALAGRYLADYGERAGKSELVGVGQGLLEGATLAADDKGFAPARLTIKAGAVDQRMGSLGPEELYALVADNPYYPREVSFYREAGQGAWAWTCAPSLTAQSGASGIAFTARFPEGQAHYLAIYGVRAFANIQLYGIDYSADREFEIYNASGFLYEGGRRALYLKMKHKKESEDIRLSY
jgi:hypothetical protein